MKNPRSMNLDELQSLPVIKAKDILDSAEKLGGCFKDRQGVLWGTCFSGKVWARYKVVQPNRRGGTPELKLTQFGILRGCIDSCDGIKLSGWVQDPARPDVAVCVDVMVDGRFVVRFYADQFRPDLVDAGIGDGRHGFALEFPAPLARDVDHLVVLQRSGDGVFFDAAAVVARESASEMARREASLPE